MRAYRIAYDGTGYRGFQRQPHGDTVENALFEALDALGVTDGGKPDGYSAAGRTDAGVSAIQQTVAFEAPDWLTPRVLAAELPSGVCAWASADAPDGFHATRDALRREYEYHLYAPGAAGDGGEGDDRDETVAKDRDATIADGRHPSALDDDLARVVLDRLSGSHDVHNLTPDREGTDRTLDATCERDGAYLVCAFAAAGFPREFVRRAVGLLVAVASGDRDPAFLDRVLSGERLQGPDGVGPAPPEPLLLRRVAYDLDFAVDDDAAASARAVFEESRVRRRTGERVARRLRDGSSSGR